LKFFGGISRQRATYALSGKPYFPKTVCAECGVLINGERKKFRVPTKILRMLKKQAVTTHYKSAKTD